MKNVFVILFLTSLVFASCNEEPKPLNITKIENKKPTIDDLLSTTIVRNLPPKDIRNIDSLRGYKMLKLGLSIDDFDSGSFVNCNVIGNLQTMYRRQDEEIVKLFFYKKILVRIEIENKTAEDCRANLEKDKIFIWEEDLINTFGIPNLEKSIIKNKGFETREKQLRTFIWRSKNNIKVYYQIRETALYRMYEKPSKYIGEKRSYITERSGTLRFIRYFIIDMIPWKKYEKEQDDIRNALTKKKKIEEFLKKKKNDSLRIINSQNSL